MAIELLTGPSFISLEAGPRPRRPVELGYASLVLLTRFRDALRATAKLFDACRKAERRAEPMKFRGCVPPLFFFDRTAQAEWDAKRVARPTFPEPYLAAVAKKYPAEALAHSRLPETIDDVRTLLTRIEVRRAARAIPGFLEAIAALKNDVAGLPAIDAMMSVADDRIVRAIHPPTLQGVRVLLDGVTDLDGLHRLLANVLPGRRSDSSKGFSPRFQLLKPSALGDDGRLPVGMDGANHWLFGEQSPLAIPMERGEHVLLLGDPVCTAYWPANRRIDGKLEMLERLDRADVTAWLVQRCPKLPTSAGLARVA